MHHFSTSSFATLSVKADRQEIWRVVVPKVAYSCDFLMHGLLAFSALHLASLKPENAFTYTEVAAMHQNIGLGSFRTALTNITDENCNAVFAFSSLVVGYALTLPIRNGNNTLPEPIDNAVELFTLSLGVAEVLKPCSERVKNGSLAPLLLTGYFQTPLPTEKLVHLE